jgi:hypothetical protein
MTNVAQQTLGIPSTDLAVSVVAKMANGIKSTNLAIGRPVGAKWHIHRAIVGHSHSRALNVSRGIQRMLRPYLVL